MDAHHPEAPVITVRDADAGDTRFLWDMLHEASFAVAESKPTREAICEPQIARYLADWGRAGDRALVAERDGGRVGAAWYRLFPRADPGYGFVDEETPELSIAVVPEARGQGVGRCLLEGLLRAAQRDGFTALSLSVGCTNTAARALYERSGFAVVATDEDEDAVTMAARLG